MSGTLTSTLQIDDLGLQIEGPPEWIGAFRELWPGWMGNAAVDHWTLSIRMDPDVPAAGPPYRTHLRFADGVCHVTSPGLLGTIDSSRTAAHLKAHPRTHIGDLSIFVRTCLALEAFDQGGLLFHAAGVVHGGHGYALFGPSGSGKTTAARFSETSDVLNDDLILIKPAESGWLLWGTPFARGVIPQKPPAPLRALLSLVQDREDRLEVMRPGTLLGKVVANSPVINVHTAWLPTLLSRWQGILDEVPARALHFRKGRAFWEVVDAEFG